MRAICLDIETYGKCVNDAFGRPLPAQRCFHPAKSLRTDLCPPSSLVLTAAITLPIGIGGGEPSLAAISSWSPGDTYYFELWRPAHLKILVDWIRWSDTILGMNIPFDVSYLRSFDPRLATALPWRRHFLLDVAVLNYLDHESRPEKSLKSLGPLFGAYCYREELATDRYLSPLDPNHRTYNCSDTHNTVTMAATLATSILATHPAKEGCLPFWSSNLWAAIQLAYSGHCYSIPKLEALERRHLQRASIASARASARGLLLEGQGSSTPSDPRSKQAWAGRLASSHPIDMRNDPLELTPKRKEVSWSDKNRDVLLRAMPLGHPDRTTLLYADIHAKSQKMVSSYTFPMLRHKRRDPDHRQSTLIRLPHKPSVGIAFPTWFVTPSAVKDDSGSEGGTLQSRYAAKNPAMQTDPPEVKACYTSRYAFGMLASFDLSQIELRVPAVLCGEPSLLDAYRNGWDLHSRRALDIWPSHELHRRYPETIGVDIDRWRKVCQRFADEERQVCKTVNFADLFRASAATMQRQTEKKTGLRFPIEIFSGIERRRPTTRPVLWQWQESLIRDVRKDGHLLLPWTGHSRTFSGRLSDHINEICNFPVQATASVVMHHLHHRIAAAIPAPDSDGCWVHLTNQVHDALYFDLQSPSRLPELKAIVADAFEKEQTEGYWARLCERTGHHCPLQYELTAKENA